MKSMLKKGVAALLVVLMIMSLVACGGSGGGQSDDGGAAAEGSGSGEATGNWTDAFTEENGVYTTVCTEGTPVEGGGYKIIVDTNENTVQFIICDASGNETVEYLTLNYATQMIERFQFVSAMGQGFYYYADINGDNLSTFNTDGEDRTQGAIDSGHYDSAVDATRQMITDTTSFFETTFGIAAEQAAMGN